MKERTFTLLAPEVIGFGTEDLRATILNSGGQTMTSIYHVPFERKHSIIIFLYLVSKIHDWDGKSKLLVKCSTAEIARGIGVNPKSGSIRTKINNSLKELHQLGVINLYSQPKKTDYPYRVVNHNVTDLVAEFESAKKYTHYIQINPNFIYDKSCKYYLPVPDEIISHTELNYTDKLVYIAILKFSWSTSARKMSDFKEISVETICNFVNISDSAVKRSTRKLEELGLIKKFMKTILIDDEFTRVVKYIPLIMCLVNPSTKKLQVIELEDVTKDEVWGE